MPGLNHTGPTGEGPLTGKQMGKCRKSDSENIQSSGLGNGFGRGRRNRFAASEENTVTGRGYGNRHGRGFGKNKNQ